MSAAAGRLKSKKGLTTLIFGLTLLASAILPVPAGAESPGVTTEAASEVAFTSAMLNGSVNPHGFETTYRFEYGTTASYGTSVPVPDKSGGSGMSGVKVSETASGLKAGTTYHFRIAAVSAEGSSFGKDETFTTKVDSRFLLASGSEGTGNGQFKSPNGIAVDSSGNLWVVDTGNHRVQKFNSSGEYLSKFGSEGTGNGQFKSPNGIAVDPEGNIWVTDTGNHRVQKFSSSGEYLSKFGSEGTGNGQFNSPKGLTVGSFGSIWVTDTGNHRVQKFTSEGIYQSKFGSEGTGNGQFKSPNGIAVDSSGNVWVVDTGNHRVQKFTSEGIYQSKFGSEGTGNGQFKSPKGLAIDAGGKLWVTDAGNSRVQGFSSGGEYASQFGSSGSGSGQFSETTGVAADSEGDIWVADTSANRTQKWRPNRPAVTTEAADELTKESATLHGAVNPNGLETTYRFEYGTTPSYGASVPVPDKSIGSGTGSVEVEEEISGLIMGTTYYFRLVGTSAEGTKFGKVKTFATKADDPRFSFAFGFEGQFGAPLGIATNAGGNLWVTDSHRVQKFNSSGEYLSKFGSWGKFEGQFCYPKGIAVDSSGNAWVVDCNSRVQVFNASGVYLGKFASEGEGNGQLQNPYDVALDASGNVWVVDTGNHRIQKFNSEGKYQSKFGSEGSGNGQFSEPTGIAIDSEGNIWVADRANHRIQKFDSGGEYQSQFGAYGFEDGQLNGPYDIAIDAGGKLWVTDQYSHRVQGFDAEGEYLSKFGSEGFGGGQFAEPAGITVDSSGNLWVVDTSNNRVQKWIPNRPTTITEAADELTSSAATLHGSVNPNGLETTYRFEYGTTTAYGTSVPVPDEGIGSGSSPSEVGEGLGGLKSATTYHFRLVATNSEGTSFGKDETFTTK